VGGLVADGRWNAKGRFRISYSSLSPETALAESLAHVRYFNLPEANALPRVLVSLRVDLRRVLFLSDGRLRMRLKLSEQTIRKHDWRRVNRRRKEALTQAWGRSLAMAGYEAIVVPSAAGDGKNLIVFPESLTEDSTFQVENEVDWT
jgi:RES domain-containing protein